MAGKISHFGETANHSIDFDVADMEHFIDFSDEITRVLPTAEVTFHDKPIFGEPWVQVDVKDVLEPWKGYTLMVDEGQTLYIGETEVWVGSHE